MMECDLAGTEQGWQFGSITPAVPKGDRRAVRVPVAAAAARAALTVARALGKVNEVYVRGLLAARRGQSWGSDSRGGSGKTIRVANET